MPSPFASLTTSDPIPVPFDEGQTVTVRMLTGAEYEAAQVAHRDGLFGVAPRSWARTFRRMLEKGAGDAEVLAALADPLTGFDRYVLVRSGLVSWSYTGVIHRKEPPPEEYDAIRDLHDDAVDFIAREVLTRTKPSLFQTAEEAEADRKKSTELSTVA